MNRSSLEEERNAKNYTNRNGDSRSRCSYRYARCPCDEQRSHILSWQFTYRIVRRKMREYCYNNGFRRYRDEPKHSDRNDWNTYWSDHRSIRGHNKYSDMHVFYKPDTE